VFNRLLWLDNGPQKEAGVHVQLNAVSTSG
jgi:hypothetical protein